MLLLPPEFLAQQAQQGPPFGWPMPFMAGPGAPPPPGMGRLLGGFPGRGGGGGAFPRAVPVRREVRDLTAWSAHQQAAVRLRGLLGACSGARKTRRLGR